MAARRLIIVLGILFAISIAAAAVAPQRPITASTEAETTTEAVTQPRAGGGEVDERFLASASSPPTVRAEVGDQLSLSVDADEPLEVEIAEFGLIANAGPVAPALFDVLLRTPGEVAVTDAGTGRVIGRLLVAPEPAQ